MTGRDFWARRKAAVQAEADADALADREREARAERAALEERPDTEILAELDLPDPDTLQAGDNVAGFMAQAVPERIRRRALRQLWRLNPVLANVDGLVEYGEDFTDSATVIENLQTAYAVGKGFVAQLTDPDPDPDGDETASAPEATRPDTPLAASGPSSEHVNTTKVAVVAAAIDHDTETEIPAPAPRRMRFEFEG